MTTWKIIWTMTYSILILKAMTKTSQRKESVCIVAMYLFVFFVITRKQTGF